MIRYTEQRVPEGYVVKAFELGRQNDAIRALELEVGRHHACEAIAVSSGTMAVLLALQALPQQQVIVPNNTFVGVLNAARMSWHDYSTHNVSQDTGVLWYTHSREPQIALLTNIGGALPGDAVLDWHDAKVRDPNLTIVQDMSHDPCGYFSQGATLGVISLDFAKPVATWEGGLVLTRDPLLAERVRALRDNGRYMGNNQHTTLIGFNGHMPAPCADLALASWKAYDVERVREIRARYDEAFKAQSCGGHYLYFILDWKKNIQRALRDANIESPVIYSSFNGMSNHFCDRWTVLPMHRYMSEQDIEHVIKTVRSAP